MTAPAAQSDPLPSARQKAPDESRGARSRGESRAGIAVLVLLIAHLAFGVVRIPGRVFGKRLEDIAEYRERGGARYHLDNRHRQGAEVVQRIVAETPENAIVPWRGEWKGALEFVPVLIAPRLLVAASEIPADADSFLGRPIARIRDDGGRLSVPIVIGLPDRVELELR